MTKPGNSRKEVASALKQLREWPILTKADLGPWYEAAHRATAIICAGECALTDGDFHFLMHWLADADIRLKDAEYRRMQDARLCELLAKLDSSN